MSNDEIISELKAKGLPTFGMYNERKDRLKKAHGIDASVNASQQQENNN